MALDPSISLGVRVPTINLDVPSPIAQMGQLMSLRGLMESQQLRRSQIAQEEMKLDMLRQANRGQEEFRRRTLAGENLTPEQTVGILGTKTGGDYLKSQAELAEKNFDRQSKIYTRMYQLLGSAKDTPTWNNAVLQAHGEGILTPDEARRYVQQGYDQNLVGQMLRFTMDGKQQADYGLAEARAKREEQEAGDKAKQAQATLAKTNLETGQKQREQDASVLAAASAKGPDQFAAALATLPAERQAIFAGAKTPLEVMQRALEPEKLITTTQAAATAAETARHNRETAALTLRGQNMADSRARELAELQREAVQVARDNKPPTEAMRTVAVYVARMEQAEKTFDVIPQVGIWQNNAPNWLKSTAGQQFEQAARNFINANLRRESGAAISSSEFENAYDQYIPQPGDKPEKLQQKADNRAIVRESFKSAAGKAYESADQLLIKSTAAMPQSFSRQDLGKIYRTNDGRRVRIIEVDPKDSTRARMVEVK